jgi:phosphohistidine swiveling domain-containing protein
VISFSTKAETLDRLCGVIKSACVLPQVRFQADTWPGVAATVLENVRIAGWREKPVIVRSSASAEDGAMGSMAGHFKSILNVIGDEALRDAVDEVVKSYGKASSADQIFIQPMLTDVVCSGVAFSHDPNTGGPYFVINYDDATGSTSSVTSGQSNETKTYYGYRYAPRPPEGRLGEIIALMVELETIFSEPALDVEFAFTRDGRLHLLQVRPLAGSTPIARPDEHRSALADIHRKLIDAARPHPYLHGERALFGVMPDWNPAEIIGVRPRPLALSLYKDVITDNIWAYQRDNYGYSNLRSFPLMQSFCGLPYIDVRVDFNSFIPKDVPPELARKLVNYYMEQLAATPSHHDKIEFEIVFSCYTLDLTERLRSLPGDIFSADDCAQLADSLRRLTNRIIHAETGLWRQDVERIKHLASAQEALAGSRLEPISKIYWLLEDCKRYGTLPFAGLARAAFIAVQQLRSLVAVGILSEHECEAFMASLDLVSSLMGRDFRALERDEFLKRYGHLRPGTYDVLSPRYDEEPDRYFDWTVRKGPAAERTSFTLSLDKLRRTGQMLKEHGLDYDVLGFFDFIRQAIEGREHAKFVFTRSLSEALSLFKKLCLDAGLSADDCSYVDIRCIAELYSSSANPSDVLARSVAEGRARHGLTQQIVLPPLITTAEDIWGFHWPEAAPNFISLKEASGVVAFADCDRSKMASSILFIPSADPGYDWVFSQGIAGLVTMYGGVNSHMAIRAGELSIPAVIGAGEILYQRWATARRIRLDCANKQVSIIA